MPTPGTSQPTEVELQILRILWDLGPSPVRDIHARLQAAKDTNYSTTVKMLSVMLQKETGDPNGRPAAAYLPCHCQSRGGWKTHGQESDRQGL